MLTAIYQPNIKLSAPRGWVISPGAGGTISMLPPRWDQATYLPKSSGAAVFSVLTSLKYSTARSAPEHEVASHIKKAYTKPGQTKPPFSKKTLPGGTPSSPLTRLYWDDKRREKNRNRAVYNCTKYWGRNYSQGGKKECDEFPFASTYEGAAGSTYNPRQDPLNFSVMPVSKDSNGVAGNLLAQYYKLNRIIDGPDDGFTAEITS
ncbi:NucA/NucB deoxyribonuclease domain-containing protein [Streptomyces sp. NPDC003374]